MNFCKQCSSSARINQARGNEAHIQFSSQCTLLLKERLQIYPIQPRPSTNPENATGNSDASATGSLPTSGAQTNGAISYVPQPVRTTSNLIQNAYMLSLIHI